MEGELSRDDERTGLKLQFDALLAEYKMLITTETEFKHAALIHIEDLKIVEQYKERGGLTQAIGKWRNFEEVAKSIEDISKLRKEMDNARDLSF